MQNAVYEALQKYVRGEGWQQQQQPQQEQQQQQQQVGSSREGLHVPWLDFRINSSNNKTMVAKAASSDFDVQVKYKFIVYCK